MSDDFDKEAEREKLREKFADDDEKREHTQRMSELLLQGATMTNRHCDDCGDPIFRHDGQEFCPTCQAEKSGDGTGANAPTDSATDMTSGGASPTTDHSTPTATEPKTATRANGTDESRGHVGDRSGASEAVGSADRSRSRDSGIAASETGVSGTGDSGMTGPVTVADARASLTETLVRFARAAETTDDPRRAREHLRAAREAAETLAALD